MLTLSREMKTIRKSLKELMKMNPHRVWGPPTHDTFLAKAINDLEDCFKRIPVIPVTKSLIDL
jgi:hypothetical protein